MFEFANSIILQMGSDIYNINLISQPPHRHSSSSSSIIFPLYFLHSSSSSLDLNISEYIIFITIYIFPSIILCDYYYTWHMMLYTTTLSYCVYIMLLQEYSRNVLRIPLFILHYTFVYDYNYVQIVKIYCTTHIFQIDYGKSCVI